jgi:hypothetical protein
MGAATSVEAGGANRPSGKCNRHLQTRWIKAERLAESVVGTRENGLVPVSDIHGTAWQHALTNKLRTLQTFYPSLFSKILILNAPALLTRFAKMIRFFVSAQHANDIVFLKNTREILDYVCAEVVPKQLGGTLVDTIGHCGRRD